MDLAAIQRRVKVLADQRATLDGLDTPSLTRIASKTFDEVESTLYDAIKDEWYMALGGPLTLIASHYIQKSRYKDAFEKLAYSKGWLENAQQAQSDSMKRVALKQSFSDSAYALQLFGQESGKGSTPSVIVKNAKDVVSEEVEVLKRRAIMGAIFAVIFMVAMSKDGKR